MAEEQINYAAQALEGVNNKLKDLEEKQRALKDQLLLIGQNLIDVKENSNRKILEIKRDVEIIKQTMNRLVAFLEMASGEFSKFAKKEDLEILAKQARIFQI